MQESLCTSADPITVYTSVTQHSYRDSNHSWIRWRSGQGQAVFQYASFTGMSTRLVPSKRAYAKQHASQATQWGCLGALLCRTAVAWVLNHLPETIIRKRPCALEITRLVSLLLVLSLFRDRRRYCTSGAETLGAATAPNQRLLAPGSCAGKSTSGPVILCLELLYTRCYCY